MPDEDIDKMPVPGAKLRSLITDVQAVTRARIPHALGGGKDNKIDAVAEFARVCHGVLFNKFKEVASRRKAGGYPMWTILVKSMAMTELEARWLCEKLGFDPETTVRDREGK